MQDGKADQRIMCNGCGGATWHRKLFEHRVEEELYANDGEAMGVGTVTTWEVLQCQGCREVTLSQVEEFPWEDAPIKTYLPERRIHFHQSKTYQKLPSNLEALYTELVQAFNQNQLLLCAAGLRALLEGLCQDRGIQEGPNDRNEVTSTLEGKINGLSSIVPPGIVRNLHGFRFLGNRALHELERPQKEHLELALVVVEDILNVVYDLNYKSELLFKRASAPKGKTDKETDVPF